MTSTKLRPAIILLLFLVALGCAKQNEWENPSITLIENPAGDGARYPNLASDQDRGSVIASWLVPSDTLSQLFWAKYEYSEWSEPLEIARGDSFFVNWADFPSVANWQGRPLAAHWLNRVPGGTYAYHLNMSFYDSTSTWQEAFTPHLDRSPTEHGFASLLPMDSSSVFALWLDGQNMASMTHGHMQPKKDNKDGKSDLTTAMTLRSVILHSDGTKSDELQVDSAVCECCQTSLARSGDNIIAVYRNRDEYETREIFKAVYSLTNQKWSEPVQLSNDGWVISGCPVNGPQIAAYDKIVIATWFNAANNEPKTYAAVSYDGGLTFDNPILLAEDITAGRVDVAFNSTGVALLTWVSTGDTSTVIGRIWENGLLHEPIIFGEIPGTRASGFPRSAGIDEDFLVMWTDAELPFNLVSVLVSSGL